MPLALLGLHAALALVAPAVVRVLGRRALWVCAAAPAAATAWALAQAPGVVGRGEALQLEYAWVPSAGLNAAFRLDAFALLMVLLVSGIGVLVFAYAGAYFPSGKRDLGGFAAALTGFAGSMLGLVLADNLILLFVFWEATSITSFLLIGTNDRSQESRSAALQALLTTGAGGLALLGGVVLVAQSAGTYSLSEILSNPPDGTAVVWGLVLILAGAFTKSAQVPFHAWLPAAMAAPTPVSAYLHSATMVKAGVFVVAKFAPAFASMPGWRPLIIVVGAATMLVGGYRALRQHDLKLLLAYGTVSQLGFMTVMFGIGTPDATFAGATLILAHGLFKAALFMVVGVIDVRTGTRDVRELKGLRRVLPVELVTSVIAAASMAGLPPLLGFIAKEAAYEGLLHGGFGPLGPVAVVAIVVGSALTMAYSAKFVHGAFWGAGTPTTTRRPGSAVLSGPGLALAALTVAAGLVPLVADGLVNAAAVALDPGWEPHVLSLWHGFTLALGLSLLAVAAGVALFALRDRVGALQERAPSWPTAKGGYEASLRGVLTLAHRTTGILQNGSLPAYLVVILVTVVALPATALITRASLPTEALLTEHPLQAAICIVAIVAASSTALVARRFAAVLLLGAVGYSVAALFVLHGAPDLALTQMLIETLSLVIFVLVLRHLPARFGQRPQRIDRIVRFSVATVVGLGVFLFSLIAAASRTGQPISQEYVERALPDAEGRNIVNVILVDFRALDTLGEIVVLVVAALGISSLVLAGRLSRGGERAERGGERAEEESS